MTSVLAAPKILIVNCFPDEREMYVEYLEHIGLHAVQRCGAEEALAAAIAMRPDVIITDIVLPHVDGIELVRQLRTEPRTAGACIAVLSAVATPQHRQDALAAGANMFLSKPCLPDALVHEIHRCLPSKEQAK